MGKKEETIKKLARKYNIDPRVVRLVVDYPLKFTKERMADDEDWRPIRIRYLAVFLPKSAGHEYEKSDSIGQDRWKSIKTEEYGRLSGETKKEKVLQGVR